MRRYLARLALLLACLLACLLVVSACDLPLIGGIGGLGDSSTARQQMTPLSGTSWALTQLTISGHSQPLAPTAPVTLQFQASGDTYLGSSGCNYYSGAYAISGRQLHLEFGAVTQRACAGPIMSQEVAYLNAMEQVRSYQRDDKTLTLQDGAGKPILVYADANQATRYSAKDPSAKCVHWGRYVNVSIHSSGMLASQTSSNASMACAIGSV